MSMLEPEDIAEWEERRKIRVIELSTKEREQETQQLFETIQPLLDKGYTYNLALREVKGLETLNTSNAWYRDVIEYGESQGYSRKEYSKRRRPVCK